MRLTQDDEMVHTLAPDRSDQPFGKAILPGRGWCSRLVPDAHGTQAACDDGAVNPIPIANDVLRGIIPRKCLGHYDLSDVLSRRCRDRSSCEDCRKTTHAPWNASPAMIEATITSGQTVPVPNTPNAASTQKMERVGLQRRRPPYGTALMARALSIGKLFESRVKSGSFTRS
jgi:hypothetical protein